jgi:hypothetical protein
MASSKYFSSLIEATMKKNTILYSLNIQDAQTVSLDVIGRELNKDEMKKIKDLIAERINWYDAFVVAIHEAIKLNE